ncbi:zinc finger protein 16-like isoform X17 [Ostrinia nubilalis]|uniref:zinc finger protein 16-like isoform X17 n=1 Tax=Ostrinia nubilalis TaxID=29057 RepID=UPI0030824CA0
MAAKTTDWRPGPTVCRCCLSEGCYKDISTEYFWMGKREVYSEMLSETFSLSIAYSTSGGPNSNSRLICEPCISRLRDASDFKRQVQECEKTFMQYLDPGTERLSDFETAESRIEVTLESLETEVKVEQVKTEKDESDGDDFGDRTDFPDLDDDDDDLDDQPLTRLATRVPKKESVDTEADSKPEKRKATTKAKTSPAKKAKTKKEVVKATTSKAAKPTEKKKKDYDYFVKRNAEIILKYTTAYPFRLPECSVVCVYCNKTFTEPAVFRRHMDDEHEDFPLRHVFSHYYPIGYIKADCTELKCRLCLIKHEYLQNAAEHLLRDHNMSDLDLKCDLGIYPFKLDVDRYGCAMCDEKFGGLRALSKHVTKHFSQHMYTCESCGKSYATLSSLKAHITGSHVLGDQRYCRKCKSTFKTLEARRKHLAESPKCWNHVCRVCNKRFITWNQRKTHQVQEHGVQKHSYICPECGEIFFDGSAYNRHFKINHTNQNFACSDCGLKFENERRLEEHRVVHTKERLFPCTVCLKSFSRKKNLNQHMWIHMEHKRFECTFCNKQFNQRVSWRTHMKSYHPGFEIPPYQPPNAFNDAQNKETC